MGIKNPSGLAAGWGDHTSRIFKDLWLSILDWEETRRGHIYNI
jgi:hypothetical protein